MPNILIQLAKTQAQLPTGVSFAKTNLVVTDGAGAAQNVSLTGSETPPWSAIMTGIAPGNGTVVATDVDTGGNTIGSPVTQGFTVAAPPAMFPQTSGITVTPQ